jgi:hypothetical protein
MNIVIERADGGVSFMSINDAYLDARVELGDDVAVVISEVIAKWSVHRPGQYVAHRMIAENFPIPGPFRNALKPDLTVDMQKARNIHRDRMREARKPKLEALDMEYSRLDEGTLDNGQAGSAAKQAKKAIAAQRQALRDVTADPAIDAAQTPEELLAIWPEILQ